MDSTFLLPYVYPPVFLDKSRYDVILKLADLPDSTNLVAGCYDGRVLTWNIGQGTVLHPQCFQPLAHPN